MSILEDLGVKTAGLTTTDKPFSAWGGSPIQNWEIRMSMLNMGDLADIAKLTTHAGPVEAGYLSKIYLLAKSLKTIDNQPVVTEEDIEQYNEDHNLSGIHKVSMFGYKVLFIRKWSESIVNRLIYMYDAIQDEYLSKHLGIVLPDELKASKVQGVDLENIVAPSDDQNKDMSDGDDNNPPNTT